MIQQVIPSWPLTEITVEDAIRLYQEGKDGEKYKIDHPYTVSILLQK